MWVLVYLVLIISQLGRHWWPEWSFVYGIKVDYLSPTLFLTDLVWLGAFLNNRLKKKKRDLVPLGKYIGWIVLIIVNILVADRWQVALYKWFRWWQIWWWVRYLADNKRTVLKWLPKIIGWWIGIEAVLALGQVVNGGSIGGVFYWLGERRFDYMTVGIARISWFGDNFVRAYGTFSHPNSLAGFLLVAILFLNEIKDKKNNKIWIWIINWLAVIGIVLTGSRLVWSVGLLILIFRFRSKPGLKLVFTGLVLMVASLLFENRLRWLSGWSGDSVLLRLNLNKIALEMFSELPVMGAGLGNFLVKLPDYLSGFWTIQPVHNVFLLVLVEMGVIGFGWLWLFLNKRVNWKVFRWIWLAVIFTGMFDHYWLSLPQNIALLSAVTAMSLKK